MMKANERRIPARWLAALFCLVPFATAFSGTVTAVEGTLSNGSVITISGSGFGAKANPKPLYFWDYSRGLASSNLGRNTLNTATNGTISTSVVAPGSAQALAFDMSSTTTAFGPGGTSDGIPFSSSSLYVWQKKYYNFDLVADSAANGMNLKFFRLWYMWTHDIYAGYQGSMGAASGRTMPEQTQELAKWWTMPFEGRRWITEEYEYRASDVGTQNGKLNYTRDGVSAWERATGFSTRTSTHSQLYNGLFFDQISNNQLSPGKMLYADAIYVDDTWQRVLISDEPTWQSVVYGSGTKRKREIQVPVAWNDTSIQVTLRTGSLGTISGRYLYVIGPDGNPANQVGFLLGGPNAKVPNAPTAVTVQ